MQRNIFTLADGRAVLRGVAARLRIFLNQEFMMKLHKLAILLLLVTPVAQGGDHGQESFSELCGECHMQAGTPKSAPPIFVVKRHVLRYFAEKDAFVERLVNWVADPDPDRALMPGAVRRFGLMPKLPYSADQVRTAAEFIYETELMRPR